MAYTSNLEAFKQALSSATEEPQEVIELCKENSKMFGNFFIRFLNIYREGLITLLQEVNKDRLVCHQQNIVKSALHAMMQDMLSLCIRSLIVEINEKKEANLLVGEDAIERYEAFHAHLLNEDVLVALLEKYPVLTYLMDILISTRLALVKELLQNLLSDHPSLSQAFGMEIKEVQNIHFSSGDTHNGGKKVLIISTDQGKLVYKPHGLTPERLFNKILDKINDSHTLEYRLNTVKVLHCNDHGWQAYVEYRSCESLEEVRRYFYRVGIFLAIFHVLGCDDLHYENLIANGEHPVVIDLETFFKNKVPNIEMQENPQMVFHKHINQSVLGTMLLPMNIQNSVFDFDLGGISRSGDETSDFWKSYLIEFEGTDDIQLSKMSVLHQGDQHNRVCLNHERIEPIDFASELQEGFKSSYQYIIDYKEQFIQLVLHENIEVRQVLRATSVYARFLEASTHPNYLKRFEDRQTLLTKLRIQKYEKNEQIKAKNLCEIESLMQLDIPYFSTCLDTNDLRWDQKTTLPQFYDSNLKEIVLNKIHSISPSSMEKQLYYIRMSLATSVRNTWENSALQYENKPRYFLNKHQYIDCAKELGDLLWELAVWSEDGSYCTWVTPIISDADRLKLAPLNFNLYEGGGVLLFLLFLGQETQQERYRSLALCGMKGIEEALALNPEPQMSLSLFNGLGSFIYLYYSFYVVHKDDNGYEKYKTYVEKLLDYPLEQEAVLDIIGGVSGTILLLIHIYQERSSEFLFTVIKRLGDFLYGRLQEENSNLLAGLSHGYSGYAWTMIHVGKVLKNPSYIEFGMKLIALENENYDMEKMNWKDLRTEDANSDPVFWCHGAPGIAVARANIKKILSKRDATIDHDLERAIEKTLKDGFKKEMDHSICHGIFGNIDIMLSLGQMTGRKDLIERAYQEADQAIADIKSQGIRSGLKNGFDMNTYMLGLSGIGAVLLRLHNPSYPSMLSLEIICEEGKTHEH